MMFGLPDKKPAVRSNVGDWPIVPWAMPFAPAMPPWMAGPAAKPGFMLQPLDVFLSITPFGRSPIVLEMAVGMMTFGIPRAVAMPAAEANAAAFSAAETAVGPFSIGFSSYRSEGGHATAQIASLQRLVTMLLLSAAGSAMMMSSWADGARNYGL
jgi:hypothetical protein